MIPNLPLSRRKFLKSGARYSMLAGLGGLLTTEELKRRRLANDPNCIRVWTCADCAEFGGCTKNKALDFRSAHPRPIDAKPANPNHNAEPG